MGWRHLNRQGMRALRGLCTALMVASLVLTSLGAPVAPAAASESLTGSAGETSNVGGHQVRPYTEGLSYTDGAVPPAGRAMEAQAGSPDGGSLPPASQAQDGAQGESPSGGGPIGAIHGSPLRPGGTLPPGDQPRQALAETAGHLSAQGGLPRVLAAAGDEYWSTLGTGLNAETRAVAFDSAGNLYVGGDFTTAGGNAANRVAKWNDSAWSSLSTGANGIVRAVAFDSSGNLYVGGDFTSAGGVANTAKIAKWNGSAWSALGTGMDARVRDIAFDSSGNLYAAGDFTTAGSVSANRIAKWNGTTWSALSSGLNGDAHDMVLDSSGNLYVGGPSPRPVASAPAVSPSGTAAAGRPWAAA